MEVESQNLKKYFNMLFLRSPMTFFDTETDFKSIIIIIITCYEYNYTCYSCCLLRNSLYRAAWMKKASVAKNLGTEDYTQSPDTEILVLSLHLRAIRDFACKAQRHSIE